MCWVLVKVLRVQTHIDAQHVLMWQRRKPSTGEVVRLAQHILMWQRREPSRGEVVRL